MRSIHIHTSTEFNVVMTPAQYFRDACKKGNIELVKLLLTVPTIDINSEGGVALAEAVKQDHLEVVKLLLADKRLNPAINDHSAVREAVDQDLPDMVSLLLADPRVVEPTKYHTTLSWAADHGYFEVVKFLLRDSVPTSINPTLLAIKNGYLDVLELIWKHQKPSQRQIFFEWVAKTDSQPQITPEVIKILLTDPDLDITLDNPAIKLAVEQGNIKLVKLLLGDPRFNPLIDYEDALLIHYQEAIKKDIFYDFHKIYLAAALLKQVGIDDDTTFDILFKNSGKAEQIAKAFISFHQSGYLTHTLIPKIVHHVDYAQDIAALFAYLNPTGLLLGTNFESYVNSIFELGANAKDLNPILELIIKEGLLSNIIVYDIELREQLLDYRIKNKIILVQNYPGADNRALLHFDQNGHKTEILSGNLLEEKLRALKLYYLLTKKLNKDNIECLNNTISNKQADEIYKLVKSANCNIGCDDSRSNFDLLCNGAKYALAVLPLLKRLEWVGLVLQSNFVAAFENGHSAIALNEIFRHLNSVERLNKPNCNLIFSQANHAENLALALQTLYLLEPYDAQSVMDVCNHAEYSHTIASLLCCLNQENAALLTPKNRQLIGHNAKYSTGLLAAFNLLKKGGSLNQESLDLIFANPKHAIFIAAGKNGNSIVKGQNNGLDDFAHLHYTTKIMRQKQRFWAEHYPNNPIPEEIVTRIATLAGDNSLDTQTRDEVIRSTFQNMG